MQLKDLAIQLNDNLVVTNIRWKSRGIEISTDGGKNFRRLTYYETINLYTADLCSCDGSSSNPGSGSNINVEKLKDELKKEIIADDNFKAQVAKLVKVETPTVDTDTIETNVKTSIIEDEVFKSEIAKAVTVDTESIKTDIKNDASFKSDIAGLVNVPEVDTDTITTTVESNIKKDETFKSEIAKLVTPSTPTVDTDTIKTEVKNDLKSDTAFKAEIAKSVDTSTIKTEVESNIKEDTEFKNTVAGLIAVDTDSIKSGVKTDLKADNDFKSDIAKLVTIESPEVNTTEIETNVKKSIKEDAEFKKSIVDSVSGSIDTDQIQSNVETNIKADSVFKADIAKLVNIPTADDVSDSVKTKLGADETFKSEIAGLVEAPTVDTNAIETNVKTSIKSDTDFKNSIAESVNVDTNAISANIETNLKSNETFKKAISDSIDTTNIKTSIETDLKSDDEFKKSVKGEKGEDGKSIKSLDKDENNNIIVTFSDNTTQNIGKLNIDVSADFLTSAGFGNIRCINSKFQYYDGSNWIDIVITDSNKFIINLIPKNMKIFNLTLDKSSKSIKLNWTEPSDTIVDGELLCFVEGVKIIRKLGGIPESETDGDLILDIKKKDFGKYKSNYYIDNNINFTIGNKYYYKFFPYANTGMVNNSDINCTFIEIKEHSLFGFKIDQTESDPDNMITYIEDNENYTPVKMDYETNLFNYGDWTKDNAWFMNIKPCMLNYNGTVDYYLDPNDYTKKEDGTDSDINNINYKGNAMIQFPKIYYKIVPSSDGNSANVYISDIKIDDNYHCWSHIDANGNEIDYCYMPIYEGSLDSSNTLRSISDKTASIRTTGTQEFEYANNNNKLGFLQNCWFIETYSDTLLIKILVLLISKSTDSQRIFGNGNCSNANVLQTGTMNDKGLFWGSNQDIFGVKIFGMENYWGNRFRKIAGWFSKQGIQKVKLTYGKTDGSNVEGYQNNSENYIEIPNSLSPTGNLSFITKMLFSEYGFFPKEASSGSSSTYYCDTTYSSANIADENAIMIGNDYMESNNGRTGIFFYCGNYAFDRTFTVSLQGASICCKPLREDN